MVHQRKLKSFQVHHKYKLGIPVPRNHKEAMNLESEHGDEKWKVAEELELGQMREYDVLGY